MHALYYELLLDCGRTDLCVSAHAVYTREKRQPVDTESGFFSCLPVRGQSERGQHHGITVTFFFLPREGCRFFVKATPSPTGLIHSSRGCTFRSPPSPPDCSLSVCHSTGQCHQSKTGSSERRSAPVCFYRTDFPRSRRHIHQRYGSPSPPSASGRRMEDATLRLRDFPPLWNKPHQDDK